MNCKNCNAEIGDEEKICHWCGTKVVVEVKKKENKKKLILVIWIISVVAVLALTLVLAVSGGINFNKTHGVSGTNPQGDNNTAHTTISPSGTAQNVTDPDVTDPQNDTTSGNESSENNTLPPSENLLYIKNTQAIYYTLVDKLNPQSIINENDYVDTNNEFVFCMGEDRNTIGYYQDNSAQDSYVIPDKFIGFWSSLNNLQGIKYKIGSNIKNCKLSKNGTKLYYLKNDGGLYFTNMKEQYEVDTNVENYYVNKKCDMVLYSTYSKDLYLKIGNNSSQELASNAELQYVSEDLNTIYYIQEGTLYLVKNGDAPINIAVNVAKVLQIYETGDIYYLADQKTFLLKLPEGEYGEQEINSYSLYYYHNEQSQLIKEYCSDIITGMKGDNHNIYYAGNNQAMIAFSVFDEKELKKNNISDPYKQNKIYVCKGNTIIGDLGKVDVYSIWLNADQDKIYYLLNDLKDLYYVKIDQSSLSKRIKYAKDVSSYNLEGNSVIYYRAEIDSTHYIARDFYLNNKKIDNDVDEFTVKRIGDSEDYTYSKGDDSSLMIYHAGKSKKIDNMINNYNVYSINKIVYLKFDAQGTGKLYLYEGKDKDKLIDSDVTDIITPEITKYGYDCYID